MNAEAYRLQVGLPPFPGELRHLAFHLLAASLTTINPGARDLVLALNAAVRGERPAGEAYGVLAEIEASVVPERYPFSPEYEHNQSRLVRSPIWTRTLNAMPRFDCEAPDGHVKGDHLKCDATERAPTNKTNKKGRSRRKRGKRWTRGFLVFSCQHRVIYLTSLLINHESVRDVVTALFTRVPRESLPDVLIYDNACNLQTYTIRRLPRFFARVEFKIDDFHRGQILHAIHNCGVQYMIDRNLTPELNSSSAEQINSWLRVLVTMLRHMKIERYVDTLDMLCDLHNESLFHAA